MIKNCGLWIFVTLFFKSGVNGDSLWSYKSKGGWPKLCFEGKEQSPINLDPDTAEIANFPPFQFRGYDEIYTATIKNTGHSAEIKLNIEKKPNVTGGDLGGEFVLDAMHFHWESEHTIEHQRFPLELHLVHYDGRAENLQHALGHGRVALSPDDDAEFTSVFEAIEVLQAKPVNFNVYQTIQRLELDDFLPRDKAGYYRYRGSLTTPDCNQGVAWTVFTHTLPISKKQVETFSRFLSPNLEQMKVNYRPVQELNNRKVFLKISEVESSANINQFHFLLQPLVLYLVLNTLF